MKLLFIFLAICLSACAQRFAVHSSARSVQFEIDMSAAMAAGAFVPERDRVGVRGALPPLSWQSNLNASPSRARVYVATFALPAHYNDQVVQYKFKIDREGAGPDDGWEDGRNRVFTAKAAATKIARAFNSPGEAVPIQRTGRIDRITPQASQFVAAREVQVWLPLHYEREPTRRFPVLYMHDGQTLFDAAHAGAEWHLDETAQRLITSGAIAPVIIVAISHVGEARMDDYTPVPALRPGQTPAARVGGRAGAYANYLIKELKPFIDRTYRTQPERAHTSVGGASLGGLVSLWLAFKHHETFGAALVVSPSLWWDDEFAHRMVQGQPLPAAQFPTLWLDMGAHEGEQALPSARRVRDQLRALGFTDATLRYVEDANGAHDEASWAARAEGMLRFLYGTP
jgi:predicted alpha/beta superfamily hydrolase